MATKIYRYDSYKDSGVEWLSDIPTHWEIRRIKYLFQEINERSDDGKEDLLSVSQYTGVTNKTEKVEEGGMLTNAFTLEGYKKVKKGDLVSNIMLAWNGSLGFSPFDGITSPAYSIYRILGENNNQFFHYLFRTELYKAEFKRNSSGVIESRLRLYTDDFFRIESILPPLQEQTAIAQFLDDKTAKIDQAITIKERQINLLKERKQILIHKAVTRGLNDNVALKDSGVEWIGEIPEHWEVKQFRYVFNLGKGLTITKENLKEEGVFCINYGEIHSKYGFEVDENKHPLKCVDEDYLLNNPNSIIKTGDFVFADTSEDIEGSGNFTYLKSANEIFAGYHTVIAKPKSAINSRFFAYEFETESFRNQIRTEVKGVKVYSITQSILKRPFIWIPPLNEQNEIVNYLDNGTQKINSAINLKQKEIEKLKEYKGSLINSVVTGKVKVC
ncbi:restriction endonuclease subunit S [Aestuariibaculum lutulentum]|uniref:Restriction endonuclease subunit S n=1 Tax=Aestuariibaculum lutulentum TaxID=2920935 RepID=A0ABS9RGX7_9FLAO|nr:restriction endonuclease subunit S [Aestuariibaculum lutulentum]MCH4552201.1 restriction endonuclease subunit S [Aestuariibaculum lutulentum]